MSSYANASREDEIKAIYRTILGREADSGGLQNYASSGLSLDDIRSSIGQSPESQARKERQVEQLYQSVLGRGSDAGGLANYTRNDPRAQDGFTAEELASLERDFRGSPEYQAKQARAAAPPPPQPQPAPPSSGSSQPRFSTAYGQSPDYFGGEDYKAAKASGASDSEILGWLDQNRGLLREQNVPGGGGLYDQIKAAAGTAVASKPVDPAAGFEAVLGRYKEQFDRMTQSLNEAISGRGAIQSQYEKTLADTRAGYDRERADFQARLNSLQQQAEEATSQANQYRDEASSYQLDRLRRGVSVSGGGSGDGVDQLAANTSGARVNRGSRPMVNTQVEIDATDSVLNRKGPVVETLGSGSTRAMARSRGSAALSRPVAQAHYARRFG